MAEIAPVYFILASFFIILGAFVLGVLLVPWIGWVVETYWDWCIKKQDDSRHG
jgi:hypothetical protein